jgi:hypothetical protein
MNAARGQLARDRATNDACADDDSLRADYSNEVRVTSSSRTCASARFHWTRIGLW